MKRYDHDAAGNRIVVTLTDEQAAREVEYLAAMAAQGFWLSSTDWMVTRHRDQVDAEATTSLTAEHYAALLQYRQALRGWISQARIARDTYINDGTPLPAAPAKPEFR